MIQLECDTRVDQRFFLLYFLSFQLSIFFGGGAASDCRHKQIKTFTIKQENGAAFALFQGMRSSQVSPRSILQKQRRKPGGRCNSLEPHIRAL